MATTTATTTATTRYDKSFVERCEELYKKIKENRTIQECLNYINISEISRTELSEIIWFVFYMFFAIHNPKMEDYIQKKTNEEPKSRVTNAWADIVKNMIKRRNHTSTIVFQLYTYAYTTQSNVTSVYPKYKNDIAKQLIKSYQSNHLKTTVVLTRRLFASDATTTTATASSDTATASSDTTTASQHYHTATSSQVFTSFLEYVITTAPTTSSSSTTRDIIAKINHHIGYKRKDIIVIALLCYMKIDEDDINKKNIFIAASQDEITSASTSSASTELEIPLTQLQMSPSETGYAYDEKYKYLYT